MAIYLDHAATTPISEVALAEFNKHLKEIGNPSSLHVFGRETRRALEEAREKLATFLGCVPSEIIFTASGTEADNLAIKGLFWKSGKKVILVSAIEHHAVLDPAKWLVEKEGAELIEIPVDRDGILDLNFLNEIIERDEAKSPSLYLEEADDMAEMPSGEYDGAGDARAQGMALSKHLLGLRGGAFHKAFLEGMGLSGGAMVGAGVNTGRYEGEGRLEIVHHSEGGARSGGAKRKSHSTASQYFDGVDSYAKRIGKDAKDIAQNASLIKDVTAEGRADLGGKGRSGGAKRMVGAEDGRRKRAAVVKRVMAEKGLSMIQASKYVKEHGLY